MMRILNVRTGDDCMRRMRNLCEMYAKPMRRIIKECSNYSFNRFGAFSIVSSFANFLYAKYAKVIFRIYVRYPTYLIWFRIFAYIFNNGLEVLFWDLGCSLLCLYAKICDFAYFRILRINQVK